MANAKTRAPGRGAALSTASGAIESALPVLPAEIELPQEDESLDPAPGVPGANTDGGTLPRFRPVERLPLRAPFRYLFKRLRHGCYFLQWTPASSWLYRYNGTMRIERAGSWAVTASGDLYQHTAFKFVYRLGGFQIAVNPDPNLALGIPAFARSAYRYYIRVTGILEGYTIGDSFTLTFERHSFNQATGDWSNDGTYSAELTFKTAPSSYPASAMFCEGPVTGPGGAAAGTLRMGWISEHLRRATLEVDRVSGSVAPLDNGAGLDWRDVFRSVDWDLSVVVSDSDLTEPSGQSWSNAELHAAMVAERETGVTELDREWRYYLLCVRRLDATSRGIMFDNNLSANIDINNTPREGAAIASDWEFPDTETFGTVGGMEFGQAAGPYFRAAVHEIGHAMGLYHNTADTGFMNTTDTIAAAAAPGTFPANIVYAFNADDQKRLKHMPDPWVRPGMIPFGNPYSSTPISPDDESLVAPGLTFEIGALSAAVPYGAPVRIGMTLRNDSDAPVSAPQVFGLGSEATTGYVRTPSGAARPFRSLYLCLDEDRERTMAPGEALRRDETLLAGEDGPLFAEAGMHEVVMQLHWHGGDMPLTLEARTHVTVVAPQTVSQAEAATQILTTPEALFALVLGGDHLPDGIAALQAALADETLRPHYAVIEAKRVGRRFGRRKADPEAALALVDNATVMSASEADSIAEIAKGTAGAGRDRRRKAAAKPAADATAPRRPGRDGARQARARQKRPVG